MKPLDMRVEYASWRHWRQKVGSLLKKMPKIPVPKPKPKRVSVKLHMYDDVNPSLMPKNAQAVAGYIGGRWPTYQHLAAQFPHAKRLSVAISSAYDADVLDVEPGDASPDQAANWVKRQIVNRKKGERYNSKLPVVYTSASQGQRLIELLAKAGLRYGLDYLWWSAHYTGVEHFCSAKCGFGLKHTAHATQYTDRASGRSLDESIVGPGFFG